jgi:hypothetical protein
VLVRHYRFLTVYIVSCAGTAVVKAPERPDIRKNSQAMSDIWSPKITAIVPTGYCNNSFSYGLICAYVAPIRDQCTVATVVGIRYQSTGNGHIKATNKLSKVQTLQWPAGLCTLA